MPKPFARIFIRYYLYIKLYRSDVIEHIDAGEQVVCLSYIQLLIANLGVTCLNVGGFVFT